MHRLSPCLFVAVLFATTPEPSPAETGGQDRLVAASGQAAADLVAEGIQEPVLRALVAEALDRNPAVRAGFARARAAAQRAPQVASLPDPTAEATAFLLPPETRVGPQRLMLGFSQALPWLAKLDLKEAVALQEAVALERGVQADRLRLVTDVRRLYCELLFLDRSREIATTLLEDLDQHQEVAQTRYATGVGSTQSVLKLQAEMTRTRRELLDLDSREVALRARLNALRDRPSSTPVTRGPLPEAIGEVGLKPEQLLDQARSVRPELQAADARLARADLVERLARMARRPDFKVGVTYTLVTSRDDGAARILAPEGNGNDVFGVRGGVTLPIRRRSRAAAIQEALDLRSHAVDERRHAELAVETEVGDLAERLPLAWRRLRLVEDLLVVQAEEALESAEASYSAGTLNTLDVIDAEQVLFEALTAVDRGRADYLIGLAELEGAVGRPLPAPVANGGTEQ